MTISWRPGASNPFVNRYEFTESQQILYPFNHDWTLCDDALVRLCGPYLTLDVVKLLVEMGASLYFIDDYIFSSACKHNKHDIIEYILTSGTNMPVQDIEFIMEDMGADVDAYKIFEKCKLMGIQFKERSI